MSTSDFQTMVGEWGERTFPQATVFSILAHLAEEIDELDDAVTHPVSFTSREANIQHAAEEAGDCYMLLLHLAHRLGFDLEGIAREKFESPAFQSRTWHDDGRGYAKHVEEQP